jgi:lipoprotein-anchoring transpeptidase ErfK/SrfK
VWAPARASPLGALFVAGLLALTAVTQYAPAPARAAATGCSPGAGTPSAVGSPTDTVAWRAGLEGRTAIYGSAGSPEPRAWIDFSQAPWLLVLGADPLPTGRCMVRVRLPWRPNDAAGWISGQNVLLSPTPWRIAVSRSERTLTLFHSGRLVQRVRVVVGKPSTPTPTGLFAIVDAVSSNPAEFVGSWVLALTAHSDVLQSFDGGDGNVAIHGRGGASLLDPLGSAASHGCIRVANAAIDALVDRIGAYALPGTPVRVT